MTGSMRVGVYAERRTRQRSLRRRLLLALALVTPWLCLVAVTYVSFKFPYKQDRYGHGFRENLGDRAIAYYRLLASPARRSNAKLPLETILDLIGDAAVRHDVDPCLVRAVVTYESAFQPNAVSTTGAMGLMALMPGTASRLRVRDPFDPARNVDGGTRLLRELLEAFEGDVSLVLAAYNAGSGAVEKRGGVPPFRETEDYVRHVGGLYRMCRALESSNATVSFATGG
jgi:soluble lytic murein transglycosylase-like protein